MNILIPLAAGVGAYVLFRTASTSSPSSGVSESGAVGAPETGPNGPTSPEVVLGPIAKEGASSQVPGTFELDSTIMQGKQVLRPAPKPSMTRPIASTGGILHTAVKSCVSCPTTPKMAGTTGGQHPSATDLYIQATRLMHPMSY